MIYAILSLFFLSIGLTFVSYASKHIHPALVALIGNSLTLLAPIIISLQSKAGLKDMHRNGLYAAVAAGLLISVYTVLLGKAFATTNTAIVTPIVYGGTIVITSLAGYFLFKEKIVPLQGVGILLVLIGLSLVIYSRIRA